MFPEHSTFSVEIKNVVFTTDNGNTFPRTAIVTFVSPDGHHESVERLGYLPEEDIFNKIDNEEPLNLDHCYIDKLSITDYKDRKGLDRKDYVSIHAFSARRTFFDNRHPIDLSFTEFLEGNVDFENSYFAESSIHFHGSLFTNCGLNFSNVKMPDADLDFTNIKLGEGDVNFKNAIFGHGIKDFQDAIFGEGAKIFTNTEFGNGDVSFVNTNFGKGKVSFKVARFGGGKVDFHFAKFGEGDISFERTEFGNGKVDFRTVEFGGGRVNFNRAVFGSGEVSFEASQLKTGKISFTRTIFGNGGLNFELGEYDNADASFDRSDFGEGSISFYNSKFKTLSLKSCHLDHYLDLRIASCQSIDLSDTIARDIIDLKPYEFDLDIHTINFSGMRLIGRIFIDWDKNKVKQLIKNQKDTTRWLKAEQFRTLKQNFNVTGQYNDEDKSYVEFKRLESKALLTDAVKRNPLNAIWMYPLYIFKLIVFDWAGLYATNPLRVIISMLTCYTFFSVLFMFLNLFTSAEIICSAGEEKSLGIAGESFYFTVITFLTIGYGDYYPEGAIRWLSGIVGFTGLFLMSYFTVAFVRKILR